MKKKEDNKIILVGIGVLAVLLIILLSLKVKYREPDYNELTPEEIDLAIESEINDVQVKKLSEMEEDERIKNYASRFMDSVDNEDYAGAYELLYDDFKTNYFPTLESFEKYAKEKFPKVMSLEYTNMERNGNIYVVWVTMYDYMKPSAEGVELNLVIRENELNDFELSFSAN